MHRPDAAKNEADTTYTRTAHTPPPRNCLSKTRQPAARKTGLKPAGLCNIMET